MSENYESSSGTSEISETTEVDSGTSAEVSELNEDYEDYSDCTAEVSEGEEGTDCEYKEAAQEDYESYDDCVDETGEGEPEIEDENGESGESGEDYSDCVEASETEEAEPEAEETSEAEEGAEEVETEGDGEAEETAEEVEESETEEPTEAEEPAEEVEEAEEGETEETVEEAEAEEESEAEETPEEAEVSEPERESETEEPTEAEETVEEVEAEEDSGAEETPEEVEESETEGESETEEPTEAEEPAEEVEVSEAAEESAAEETVEAEEEAEESETEETVEEAEAAEESEAEEPTEEAEASEPEGESETEEPTEAEEPAEEVETEGDGEVEETVEEVEAEEESEAEEPPEEAEASELEGESETEEPTEAEETAEEVEVSETEETTDAEETAEGEEAALSEQIEVLEAEKDDLDQAMSEKFESLTSTDFRDENYKTQLAEYNAMQDRKAELEEQIGSLKEQQAELAENEKNALDSLNKNRLENVAYSQGNNELGYMGTCGPTSVANSLNIVTNSNRFSENAVLNEAVDSNLCHQSDNPLEAGGTGTMQVTELIEKVKDPEDNLQVEVYEYNHALSTEELAERLKDSDTVAIVGVDSATLWDESGEVTNNGLFQMKPSDHWITVESPVYDEEERLTGFRIVDSGGGVDYVDADKFEQMYQGDGTHIVEDPTAILVSNKGDAAQPEGTEAFLKNDMSETDIQRTEKNASREITESEPFELPDEIKEKLKTEPNTAVFWSGCDSVDGNNVRIPGEKNAAEYATQHGGVTLEYLIETREIPLPEWDADNEQTVKMWEAVSAAYAEQASGEVRAYVGENLREGNTWENVELPRLMMNENVEKITVINPKTGESETIFSRNNGDIEVKVNETLQKSGKWEETMDHLKKNSSVKSISYTGNSKTKIYERGSEQNGSKD